MRLGALGVAVLVGCSAPEVYRTTVDVQDMMLSVLEPAAEHYWDAVGSILEGDSVIEIRPGSSDEWEAVRNAAVVVAESGNLLMLPGRARDRGPWIDYSRALVDVGVRAVRAAESRNADSVFAVGGDVYEACTACHADYAIETVRPNSLPAR